MGSYANEMDRAERLARERGKQLAKPLPSIAPQYGVAKPVDAFRNMLAILHNLDAVDLHFLTAGQRAAFFMDPIATTLRLDDAGLDALYALVQDRQPARYRDA
jgi:hypothetical protein